MCRSWRNAHHAQDARKDQGKRKAKVKTQKAKPGVPSGRVAKENQEAKVSDKNSRGLSL
jgi:hypothetical protein